MNSDLQEGLSNAMKMGYLYINKSCIGEKTGLLQKIWGGSWLSCFFVLTDIGLLGFHSSTDCTPFCLVPVIGCTLVRQAKTISR